MLEHTICNKPVPVVPDSFGWFQMSKMEFELFKCLCCSVVSDSGADSGDDDIKVNCLPLQYFDPFGVWKLW